MNTDIRNLSKWLNEGQETPIDRQALARVLAMAEQQKPVAYAVYHRMGGSKSLHWPEQHSDAGDHNQYQLVPLYTSPPAQRIWVRLTDKELSEVYNQADWDTVNGWEYERAIEAKLNEKNA